MSADRSSPGARLRTAREALGKTTSEMAAQTRITVQQLQGLEADQYNSIPAPMYVRGFMKLYAQELGLDPTPLVEEYEKRRKGGSEPKKPVIPAENRPESPSPLPETVPKPLPAEDKPSVRTGPEPRKPTPSIFGPSNTNMEDSRWEHFKGLVENRLTDPDWWKTAWTPRILASLFLILLLLLLSRSCTASPEEDGEPPTPPPTPVAAPVISVDLPEVEDPLILQPPSLYFELPRTLE